MTHVQLRVRATESNAVSVSVTAARAQVSTVSRAHARVEQRPGPAIILVSSPGPRGRPGASGAGFVWRQDVPVTVVDIPHMLGRDGPIGAVFYSLDYSIEWDGVITQPISPDVLRVSFDDPTTFIALLT